VGPLMPSEAKALLHLLLDASQIEGRDTLVDAIIQRTGGVPYFLVSCAHALRSGALDGTTSEAIPWALAEAIRQRVSSLSETAQYLLGAVAVAGNEAQRPLILALTTLLAWDKLEALSALEQACQARLLIEMETDGYRFAHDLIRDIVVGDLSATRRAPSLAGLEPAVPAMVAAIVDRALAFEREMRTNVRSTFERLGIQWSSAFKKNDAPSIGDMRQIFLQGASPLVPRQKTAFAETQLFKSFSTNGAEVLREIMLIRNRAGHGSELVRDEVTFADVIRIRHLIFIEHVLTAAVGPESRPAR